MKREEMLRKVSERTRPWDMVIVGGGATGVGVAVDAATRGFDVLLLEIPISAKAHPADPPSWFTAECAILSRATSRW